ncbi:hypothetical protein J6590_081888, partial [Homalodisca vitripennis]
MASWIVLTSFVKLTSTFLEELDQRQCLEDYTGQLVMLATVVWRGCSVLGDWSAMGWISSRALGCPLSGGAPG